MSRRSPSKSDGKIPQPLTDKSRGPRLQKVMADLGVASRRECETLIRDGHVTVNGQAVTALPAWVDPQIDRIEVDGQLVVGTGGRKNKSVKKSSKSTGSVYIALHKPRHVISTTRDPEGRRTVMDLVKLPGRHRRMYPVGRLDADSTGLILMTNDGELANRLTHPRYEVTKQYEVSIKGRLTDDDIKRLRDGLYLALRGAGRRKKAGKAKSGSTTGKANPAARKARMSQVKRLGYQRDRTRGDRTSVLITLREGQNREIRRMLARLGFKVRRLKRVSIGPVKIKGIASGRWRMLTTSEVNRLKKAGHVPDKAD